MKQAFLVIFLSIFAISLSAQNLSVKSFRYLESDMDARIHYTKKDVNGDVCAIIKVVTPETGFSWDVGSLGIVSAERKTGEYWLYVPWGVKAITIKHDKFGVLRNFVLPIPVEKASVYEMVLITAKIRTIIEESVIENQWLTINTQPKGATVFLNDEMQSEMTPFFKKVKTGTYTYRIELARYHNTAGKIEVTADKKAQVELQLKPAFGSINVNSTPENGAAVVIDGNPSGKTTPCTLEEVKSGSHQIRLMKSMYKPVQQNVPVTDGKTTDVTIDLKPNFATVNISTKPTASIYVDGQQKATDTWKGRLDAGVHTFEARKDKHKNDTKTLDLASGDKQDFTLAPVPRKGNADIASQPMGTSITIDGKNYGTTPNTVRDLLMGNYTLKLEKSGYGTITKTITIKENQTITINETLPSGMEVTIASDPAGAELYIDDSRVGTTPFTTTLGFGKYNIKLTNGKKTVEDAIKVTQDGKTNWMFNVIDKVLLVDKRDGKTYKTVTIGNQVWMAENLNYNAGRGCWCYDDNSRNCAQYGRLYNWKTAKRACPDGWHLPSDDEWKNLEKYLGMSQSDADDSGWRGTDEGKRLKSTTGWNFNGNGTDVYGFLALPGGYRDSNGAYYYIGYNGDWWSSTESSTYNAWYRELYYDKSGVYRDYYGKGWGFSVRCVRD